MAPRAWQKFRHVTLPLVRPALLLALLFRTIDALRVFDLVFVMTQGGPADATNVLQFYGYKKTFAEGMVGYGSTIAVAVFLISLVLAVAYLRTLRSSRLEGSSAMKHDRCWRCFLSALPLYCLLPFLWFVLTSFKSPAELTAIPPKLVPSFHWGFYRSALTQHGLLRYIANSLIVAGTATGSAIARFTCRLRHRPLPAKMDKVLPARVACHVDVSADRHRRSGVERSRITSTGSIPITAW